jgi:hypothetical protein
MSTVLTQAAYARLRGVKRSTVAQWIRRGHLKDSAITADGRIVAEEADAQLRAGTLDLSKSIGRGGPVPSLLASSPQVAAVVPVIKPDNAAPDFAAVRLRREMLALEAQEIAAAKARGDLVLVTAIERRYSAELEDLLAGIEQWALDLAAKLGLGREGAERIRAEWRSFRERRALQAEAALAEKGA